MFVVVTVLAWSGLFPGEADRGEAGSHFALPSRSVLVIGLLTMICFLTEGAMLDWNAVFMRQSFATNATMTAAGYAAFAGGMATGRFSGDFIRLRVSAVRIVRWGGLLAAAGLVLATLSSDVYVSIVGFAIAGLGISNLVPLMFTAAGRANVGSAGKGVAAAATCGYCGFLAGPPIIGFLSEHTGLAPAFLLLAGGCAIVATFALAAKPANHLGQD